MKINFKLLNEKNTHKKLFNLMNNKLESSGISINEKNSQEIFLQKFIKQNSETLKSRFKYLVGRNLQESNLLSIPSLGASLAANRNRRRKGARR